MKGKTKARVTAVALSAATVAFLATGPANASPSASYIGWGYTNNPHGVWCVQHLINDIYAEQTHTGQRPMKEDGLFGAQTDSYIRWFQRQFMGTAAVDGVVGPQTGGGVLKEGDAYYGGYNYCYTYVPSDW